MPPWDQSSVLCRASSAILGAPIPQRLHQQRRQQLNTALAFLLLPCLLLGLGIGLQWALGTGNPFALSLTTGMVFSLLAAYALGRTSCLRLAGLIPVLTLFVATSLTSIQLGVGLGIYLGYGIAVVLAGFFVRPKAAWVIALMSTMVHGVLCLGPWLGLSVVNPLPAAQLPLTMLAVTMGLLGLAALSWHQARALERSFREEGQTRAILHNSQAHLEHRLTELTVTTQQLREEISQRKVAQAESQEIKQQLVQSQKMETIGHLAGGIAHDFNNLLTTINGMSDLLLIGIDHNDPIVSDLSEIRKAGIRAAALTKQLLAFSRRQHLNPEILNINALVVDMERMLGRMISENIALKTELDPKITLVKTDAVQFQQMVVNLVVNARDALPTGGQITIETKNVQRDKSGEVVPCNLQPSPLVAITVRDNGMGIAQEQIGRIFEPFYTTKQQGKGTGLGLAMVYGFVTQTGGTITVDSQLGSGTTFQVLLPCADEAEQTQIIRRELSALPRGKGTILLAEDEETVRKLVVRVLTRQGYRVLPATNGEEALGIAQERRQQNRPIDVLLTDMVMPLMGGKELAAHMRTMFPETSVLFMSGYSNESKLRNLLGPKTAFIAKPFSVESILQKIRDSLETLD